MVMNTGHFYYIGDQYFIDFPDDKLMRNKERVNGQPHDRPKPLKKGDFSNRSKGK